MDITLALLPAISSTLLVAARCFSQVCPPERATAITKHIAEFVARDLCRVGFWAGHSFLYENLVGGAVFILQLSVYFTFRISGCRKPTSIAALVIITATTANTM